LLARQSPLNAPIASLIAFASGRSGRDRGGGGFALLIARFVHLQVVQHDYYTTRAEDNRISLVPIVPNRGRHRRSPRHGPGAQLLGIHAGNHAVEGRRPRCNDRRSGQGDRGPAQGPQAFSQVARGEQDLRKPADSYSPERGRSRPFAANRYLFPGVEVKARLFRQYPLGPVARMPSATSIASTSATWR
jgi:penicillin-binding protein 2